MSGELQIVAAAGCAVAAACGLSAGLRLRRDLILLAEAARAYLRGGQAPLQLRLRTRRAASIWRCFMALGARGRAIEQSRATYQEVLGLTADVAAVADEECRAAEALLGVLMKQLSPALKGGAVVLSDFKTHELRVIGASGLPQRRIEAAVLMCFDTLFDAGPSASWGYFGAAHGPCFDLRAFGVELSLIVPLPEREAVRGGVWLGLGTASEALSPSQRHALQATVLHAAASFGAASAARLRTERSSRERDFLLGLSHDLRAPGNRALYATRDLLSGQAQLTPEQRKHLLVIHQSISEQLALLNDVFELKKHEHGLLTARRCRVPLAAACSEICSFYAAEAISRGLRFEQAVCDQTVLIVDRAHFRRMLGNLLSNALKYTRSGYIRLRSERCGGRLILFVEDSGRGIAPSDRSSLFREFYRGAEDRPDGVGFGLALTRALAELNGGSLRYAANPCGGSVFSLDLCASREGELHPQERRAAFRSILVVDDDAASRRAFLRQLRGVAEEILAAGSLEEAMDQVRAGAPDLVITDYHLGDGSAEPLLKMLDRQTVVLIVTGDTLCSPVTAGENIRVLEKPLEGRQLLEAVAACAASAQLPRIDWGGV